MTLHEFREMILASLVNEDVGNRHVLIESKLKSMKKTDLLEIMSSEPNLMDNPVEPMPRWTLRDVIIEVIGKNILEFIESLPRRQR